VVSYGTTAFQSLLNLERPGAALWPVLVLLISSFGVAIEAAEPNAAPYDYLKDIRPIIERRCESCHGADAEEAGVSFAELRDERTVLHKRALWKSSLARVATGQMPPEDAEDLTADEKKRLTDWLRYAVEHVDCDPRSRDVGPALVRRLNRVQYDNTIRELLGIDIAVAKAVGMPDDGTVDGFDNLASALSISTPLVEKYFAAADTALNTLFGYLPDATVGPTLPAKKPIAKPTNGKVEADRVAAYKRLFFVRPSDELSEGDAARKIVSTFARRAFRRPVSDAEINPLVALFEDARSKGADFDDAVRTVLKPILISPHFLLRIEQDCPPRAEALGVPVDSHELAVRLSYFLWSSMPDAELFASAESGDLLKAGELERQTRRMLADPKARALTDNFAAQWLQLTKLVDARPQTEFFPTFTNRLKDTMRLETTTFFDQLRQTDASVLDLLDSDYTYLNAELAQHYGIEGVTGTTLTRVNLKPEHHRGGLLGMGSVLAMTSHTFRTSPTQRGKYILDVLSGTPPPPPPANAGVLKDDNKDKKRSPQTFREQLAQHSTQKACAACHRKLDPLGFALDNYDAVGAWRESTVDVPLDVSGVLPDGEKLHGAADVKRVLLERKDEFCRNLVEKMLTYALGREVDYYDECTVRDVLEEMKRHEYRFSSLILGVVQSAPFQQRRPRTETGPE
jgi:hypothetical protein